MLRIHTFAVATGLAVMLSALVPTSRHRSFLERVPPGGG